MTYLVPLFLTIIIELAVIYLLGFRNKKLFILIILVNILTNPLLNFVVNKYSFDFTKILYLEIAVVIIEGIILSVCMKEKLPFFRLSFIMNATSFLIGLWLPWNIIWTVLL